MLKSGNNIFKNPTTYLYVSGVVALAALIISIIAMFTNDCKKSPFGDYVPGTTNQYGSVSEGDVCDKINASDTTACLAGSQGLNSELDICAQGLTCVNDPRNQSSSRGKCENKNKKDNRCPTQPTPQPGQGECTSSVCCNPDNDDADDECQNDDYICSSDPNERCEDPNCISTRRRKCIKATGCATVGRRCTDPDSGPQVAGAPPIPPSKICCPGFRCDSENNECVKSSDDQCRGRNRQNCKTADCEWNDKDYTPGQCVVSVSSGSGSSGSGSSGSGSDIIINKKHINIGGNTIGGDSGSIRQNSNQPSAAPPTHHHSPPPSHSPGPSGPSDSDDLTWLWITLGSVGALVLLGFIIFFSTRNPKMPFGRPRMMGFGRPYAR